MKDKFGNDLKSGDHVIMEDGKCGQLLQMHLTVAANTETFVFSEGKQLEVKVETLVSATAALAAITAANTKK